MFFKGANQTSGIGTGGSKLGSADNVDDLRRKSHRHRSCQESGSESPVESELPSELKIRVRKR